MSLDFYIFYNFLTISIIFLAVEGLEVPLDPPPVSLFHRTRLPELQQPFAQQWICDSTPTFPRRDNIIAHTWLPLTARLWLLQRLIELYYLHQMSHRIILLKLCLTHLPIPLYISSMDFFAPHKSFVPGNQHNIFQWLYGNECSHRPDLYRWIEGPVSHFVAESVSLHDEFRAVYFICLDLSSCQTTILIHDRGNRIILLQLHLEMCSMHPEQPWPSAVPLCKGTVITVLIASTDTNTTRTSRKETGGELCLMGLSDIMAEMAPFQQETGQCQDTENIRDKPTKTHNSPLAAVFSPSFKPTCSPKTQPNFAPFCSKLSLPFWNLWPSSLAPFVPHLLTHWSLSLHGTLGASPKLLHPTEPLEQNEGAFSCGDQRRLSDFITCCLKMNWIWEVSTIHSC